MVIAVPEVRHLKLEEGDEFLILACDGIWDVLSNQEVQSFSYMRLGGKYMYVCIPSKIEGICGIQTLRVGSCLDGRACDVLSLCLEAVWWKSQSCCVSAYELCPHGCQMWIKLCGDDAGGGLCAQALGEACDATGNLRSHVRSLLGPRHPGKFMM